MARYGATVWLDLWAGLYDESDEQVYFDLMEKHKKQGRLLRGDIERVGRWKEDCLQRGSWWLATENA
jgi:hypothetical protein